VVAPTRLVYGDEIVGRQADLHAVISQFSNGPSSELLTQPVTTAPGWPARAVSPVAALNVLVLWTFPLTALATFALARYLHRSSLAAVVAALVFSFRQPISAQAAQPSAHRSDSMDSAYFLALIALVDRASVWRVGGIGRGKRSADVLELRGGVDRGVGDAGGHRRILGHSDGRPR
jgi:hypothetical protein